MRKMIIARVNSTRKFDDGRVSVVLDLDDPADRDALMSMDIVSIGPQINTCTGSGGASVLTEEMLR